MKDSIIIAGSCSGETLEETMRQADVLVNNDVQYMRFMMWKPRTSPQSFQGIGGVTGIEILKKIHETHPKLTFVTEVMGAEHIQLLEDSKLPIIYQIGSRNGQNFDLLKRLGDLEGKTILYKRGMWMHLEEYLTAAEYLNPKKNNVWLCLRGIKANADVPTEKIVSAVPITMRNLPDIHSILLLKDHPQFKRHNYKILFDPSHATGISKYVRPMGIAAMLLGADGLEVEIHSMPDIAYSDKKQTINFPEFGRLLSDIKKLGENK